jgi:hypothetical protein
MELSFAIMFLGATFGVVAYLVSADFRAVVRDYRHYDWRILAGVLFALLLASWCLPLVVIKDTLSSAVVILRMFTPHLCDQHHTDQMPATLIIFVDCWRVSRFIRPSPHLSWRG